MASPKTIEVQGLDELRQALNDAPKIARPLVQTAMKNSLLLLQGAVQEYPPATAANAPGRLDEDGKPRSYYDRGEGTWYPVVKQATLGGATKKSQGAIILSKKKRAALKIYGYKLSRTSEELGRQWTTDVQFQADAVVGRLGNSASYMDYVQGAEQSETHKKIGWKTVDQALAENWPAIQDEFGRAADALIKTLNSTP